MNNILHTYNSEDNFLNFNIDKNMIKQQWLFYIEKNNNLKEIKQKLLFLYQNCPLFYNIIKELYDIENCIVSVDYLNNNEKAILILKDYGDLCFNLVDRYNQLVFKEWKNVKGRKLYFLLNGDVDSIILSRISNNEYNNKIFNYCKLKNIFMYKKYFLIKKIKTFNF